MNKQTQNLCIAIIENQTKFDNLFNVNYDTWIFNLKHYTTKELIAIFNFSIDDLMKHAKPSTESLLRQIR